MSETQFISLPRIDSVVFYRKSGILLQLTFLTGCFIVIALRFGHKFGIFVPILQLFLQFGHKFDVFVPVLRLLLRFGQNRVFYFNRTLFRDVLVSIALRFGHKFGIFVPILQLFLQFGHKFDVFVPVLRLLLRFGHKSGIFVSVCPLPMCFCEGRGGKRRRGGQAELS